MESNRSEKDVRVDRYVQNMMASEEKQAFEAEIAADALLRNEVNFRMAVVQGIRQEKNRDLRNRLQAIHKEMVNAPTPQKTEEENKGRVAAFSGRWWLAAAASVILIMAFTLWMSGVFTQPDQNLFAQYYERPSYSIDRGAADEALARAGTLYNQGMFDESALMFEDYLLTNRDDAYVRFMAAVSYLETGKTDEARSHFNKIIEENGPLTDRATWYLSLTYLQEGNESEATSWLERLAGDSQARPYNSRATELLEELH